MKKLFTILYTLLIINNLHSQGKQKLFIDTLDNAFDISYYMYNLHGLLPIPSPITEPAVGFGGVLATVYFIPKKSNTITKFKMPDIVGVTAGLTQNKTWFAGAGYLGFWKNDKIRYRGVIGYGDIKLKYYGENNDFLSKYPINFSINSSFLLQQLVFRIKNTNFLLGGKYIFSKTIVNLFENSESRFIPQIDIELQNSGIGAIAEFENYDLILSPNKGLRVHIDYMQFAEILGSSRNFGRITAFLNFYIPLFKQKLISGFRFETQSKTGRTPFYMKPFIYMRGIPAMRYQGNNIALCETEQLFMFNRRWGLNIFGGFGAIFPDYNLPKIWTAGTGFRYLIARRLGLKMGIDLAKSNNDWGIYIIFGSAWLR